MSLSRALTLALSGRNLVSRGPAVVGLRYASSEAVSQSKSPQPEDDHPHKVCMPTLMKDGHWNEDSASHSESAVKADKSAHKSVEELQEVTISIVEKRHKEEPK